MAVFLPPCVAAVSKAAARDVGRYSMTGVRVVDPGDGTYRLEATDGRRLAIIRGCSDDKVVYPPLAEVPNGLPEALIAGDEWTQAFRMGKKERPVGLVIGTQPAADDDETAKEEVVLTFAVDGQSFQTRPYDGLFPPVQEALPKRPALVEFRLDPTLLAGLMDVAAALGLRDNGGVTFLYFGKDQPLGLIGHNDQGQFLDCLLMPLS
jgi:hypothetical protein